VRMHRIAVPVIGLGLFLGSSLPGLPVHADSGVPICAGYMDNPHVSTGAGGIIAKGRWICEPGVTQVTYTLTLYLCPNPPVGQEQDWTSEGCVFEGDPNSGVIEAPIPGDTYTRYVPGNVPAHGTGYWIASNVYQSWAGSVLVTYPEVDSQAVWISG
jgi:hypothetical protein